MKDVLILVPLYYSANGVRRIAQYLEEESPAYTFDVFVFCSNRDVFSEARELCQQNGFLCELRTNDGAGAGALWWLQNRHGDVLAGYRYVWYFEESCEPVRRGWMRRLISDLESGLPVSGWWWCPEGRRRKGAIAHRIVGLNGNEVVCYENTAETGADDDGHPFDGLFDVPGYRGETFVVRASDFAEFGFPDPAEPFWEGRNGIRTYAVKAERFWWRVEDRSRHGYPHPSPNIQWHLLAKYRMFPSPANVHRGWFRELPLALRCDDGYRPSPPATRSLAHAAARVCGIAAGIRGRFWRRLSIVGRHAGPQSPRNRFE